MRFLNIEREVTAGDWSRPDWPKLWLYNAHYFDVLATDAAAANPARADAAIANWIAENPPGSGIGWEPYPLSLRIVNWIKWALDGHRLSAAALQSLAVQARYLLRRIEWHLLGNHLLANAKALVFAGVFFDSAESAGWLREGLRILAREVHEQILADGGHFERSPMYHSIVLEDLLDLLNLASSSGPQVAQELASARTGWSAAAPRMLSWLDAMCHPDGEIAFFNDAACGIAPSPSALRRYAERLGIADAGTHTIGLKSLPDSGYMKAAIGSGVLIFDAAPIGPDYLPAHAHADTLSFELSWSGQRVICNSGTSTYETGAARDWERSTAAHATVEVDGRSSSDVWRGFRVGRRARVCGVAVHRGDDSVSIEAAHDGYARLTGKLLHSRRIEMQDGLVRWRDRIAGSGVHDIVGRIPLHPDIRVEQSGTSSFELAYLDRMVLRLTIDAAATAAIEAGTYAPEFGKVLARPVIAWRLKAALPAEIVVSLRAA